jgi:glycosyltransferase involved in cell wall biosynthesis
MACGCPVLVSQGAAVHEVLTDGENAFLFPARNPKALAARIQSVATQPTLRAEVAQQGMDLVRRKFNWEQFARQISQVCNELIGQEAAGASVNTPAEPRQAQPR